MTDRFEIRTQSGPAIAKKDQEHPMTKILAAVVALTLVAGAAAPSYAFGPRDIVSTTSSK
jgi:hypothetical protein